MSGIIPFRGVVYNPEGIRDISRVAAPPYDMISPREQKALYQRDPHNVVRLILGFQKPEDNEEDNRYTRAAGTLEEWLRQRVLIRDDEPSFYVYDQEYSLERGGRYQRRGFISLVRLEEFGVGGIYPHESTMSGPKEDRLKLMMATRSNFSQIFSFYSDRESRVEAVLQENLPARPRFRFTDDKNVSHTLFSITDPSVISEITGLMKERSVFIADGHHRYETALNFRRMMKEQLGDRYSVSYDYIMMYLANTCSPGLNILPFHRLIRLPDSIGTSMVVERLRHVGELTELASGPDRAALLGDMQEKMSRAAEDEHLFGLYAPPRIFLLRHRSGTAPPRDAKGILDALDVKILHRIILEKALGGELSRAEIAYVRQESDILEKMDADDYHLAFFLNPTRVDQVREIAYAGLRMPPKSTNFHPKLVSGLVMNVMEGHDP
jgi:uncharacterized protein (DUF1015 family)